MVRWSFPCSSEVSKFSSFVGMCSISVVPGIELTVGVTLHIGGNSAFGVQLRVLEDKFVSRARRRSVARASYNGISHKMPVFSISRRVSRIRRVAAADQEQSWRTFCRDHVSRKSAPLRVDSRNSAPLYGFTDFANSGARASSQVGA